MYPNIPNYESLSSLKETLDKLQNKTAFTESLIEQVELANYLKFNDRFKKQKESTTSLAPLFVLRFIKKAVIGFAEQNKWLVSIWNTTMATLEEEFSETLFKKPWL